MGQVAKVASGNDIVVLKGNRNLFARILVVSRSRDDLNLEDTFGNYELSAVPRSLFSADGTMYHCQNKSQLTSILQAHSNEEVLNGDNATFKSNLEVYNVVWLNCRLCKKQCPNSGSASRLLSRSSIAKTSKCRRGPCNH